VLVVLIGPDWLIARDGRRRLEMPADWVREEVETSLRREIRVLPLLVKGASLPGDNQLPPSLAKLPDCQALSARGDRWNDDVQHLVREIEPLADARLRLPGAHAAAFAPFEASEWRDDLQPLLDKVRAMYVAGVLAAAESEAPLVGKR